MNGDRDDLVTRIAELERLADPGPRSRRAGWLIWTGGLLLALLLTANAWTIWRGLNALATTRIQHHFWTVCQRGATDEQRREAFVALVGAGNREWQSARLTYLKLRHGEFDGARLELADMVGCDFTGSTMVGASLRGSNLRMARLEGVDLTYATLAEADLLKADLTDAIVWDADLRSASLEQTDLKNTQFRGADLTEASLLMSLLAGADLSNANLSWANLDAADLTGAKLDGANLENASTQDTRFTDSNWWRAAGLPSRTVERLRQTAAPTSNARAEFQADYVDWLAQTPSRPSE